MRERTQEIEQIQIVGEDSPAPRPDGRETRPTQPPTPPAPDRTAARSEARASAPMAVRVPPPPPVPFSSRPTGKNRVVRPAEERLERLVDLCSWQRTTMQRLGLRVARPAGSEAAGRLDALIRRLRSRRPDPDGREALAESYRRLVAAAEENRRALDEEIRAIGELLSLTEEKSAG